MIVTRETAYEDFAPYEPHVNLEDRAKITKAAIADKFGDNGFYMLDIGTFLACVHGDFDGLFSNGGLSVFDIYRIKAFPDWLKEFTEALERLTLKPTAKQLQSQQGCEKVTFDESVFIFCRQYFGLHSFDDVLRLTVSDYLMAKKDDFNRQLIERNTANQMLKK